MSRGDVNVSPGDYAPGGLSFTDHCERRIYMDLIERGWKEENTNKKKKKTEPKSLKRKNSEKRRRRGPGSLEPIRLGLETSHKGYSRVRFVAFIFI